MNEGKKLINIAMIIELVICLFMFFVLNSIYFAIIQAIILVATFFISSDDERLAKNKGFLIFFGIMFLFCNIASAVLLFIANDKIAFYLKQNNNGNNKQLEASKEIKEVKKEVIPPEAKKIDILLKLGLGLVILSGIIFATSNSGGYFDLIKPFFILILSLMFFGLSHLFKKKIVIPSTEKTYFILANVFIICFSVSIGYYKTFGTFFSFEGEGSNFIYALILLTTGFVSINGKRKYNISILKEISIVCVLLALFFVLDYFSLNAFLVILIYLLFTLFVQLYNKEIDKSFSNISNLLMIILVPAFLYNFFRIDNNFDLFYGFICGLASLLNIILRYKDENELSGVYEIVFPIFITLFCYFIIQNINNLFFDGLLLNLDSILNYNFIAGILILGLSFIYNKINNRVNNVGMLCAVGSGFLISCYFLFNGMHIVSLIFSIIYLSYIIFNLYKNEDDNMKKTILFIQIPAIIMLSFSIINYIATKTELTFDMGIQLFVLLFALTSILENNLLEKYKADKVMFYIIACSFAFINILFLKEHSMIFNIVMLVVLFGYRFYLNKDEDKRFILNYILVLVTFLNFTNILFSNANYILSSAILLIGLVASAYYFKKDRALSYLTLITAFIPLFTIIDWLELPSELYTIIIRLILMGLTFLITRKVLKINKKSKFVIECILLSLLYVSYIFTVDLTLGLYTAIIALSMIILGYLYDKINSLFYVGIGATVVNIIVQLSEYWSKIPLFVYLLIVGLCIIAYVTYKEIKKNKDIDKKEEVEKPVVVEEEISNFEKSINVLVCVMIFLCVISLVIFNYYKSDVKKVIESSKLNDKIEAAGYDTDKLYLDSNNKTLYLLDGYEVNIYNLYIIIGDEYKKIDYYGNQYNINVCRVDQNSFNDISKGKSASYYYDYSFNCFDYNGLVNKDFSNDDIIININNDKINYVSFEEDYYNYSFNGNSVTIYYEETDASELSFCITGKNETNYKYTFLIDDTEYNIEPGAKCHAVSSETGKVVITYLIEKPGDTIYYDNGEYYYKNNPEFDID